MKKYFLNIGVVLFDRVAMLTFQIWLTAYYVKILGVSDYGVWAYTLNIITIGISIFVFGIDVIIIKDLVNDNKRSGHYVFTGMALQLIGFLFVIPLSMFILDCGNDIVRNSMLSILIANLFIILSKPFYWVYSSLVESRYRTVSVIVSFFIYVPFIIIYRVFFNSDIDALYLYAIYYAIQFFVSLSVYVFLFKSNLVLCFSSCQFIKYAKTGVALIISTLSTMLFTQTDVLMIKHFMGDSATGEFAAAVRLSTSVFILAGVIANTFYPKMIDFSDEKKIQFIKVTISTMTILTVFGSFFTMWIAQPLVTVLYGRNDNIALVLSLHIWCSIFIFAGSFTSRYLYAREMYRIEVYKTLIAAIVNILLNIYLIPKYGVVGAVVSSLSSYMLANYFALSFFKDSRDLFLVQTKAFLVIFKPRKYIKEVRKVKCLFQ